MMFHGAQVKVRLCNPFKSFSGKDSAENFFYFEPNDVWLTDKLDRMKLIYIFMILIIGTKSLKSAKFFV